MRVFRISISLLFPALVLLAGCGTAASATYKDAVCRPFGNRIENAERSGGPPAMVKEMSRLLRARRLDDMGMVAEEGVRCALMASGDVMTVVDVALAAGIDRDIVKRGIERHFKFSGIKKVDMPDLGIFETAGRMRLQIDIFGGLSVEKTVVDRTADNRDVHLNGGGGYGGGLTIGYGINPHLDLDLALGYHVTDLSPVYNGIDGSFERYSALASLKYRMYASARSWFKLGLGAGYFVPVMFRKGSDKSGYEEVEFDNAPGGVFSVEYESAIGKETTSSSIVLGMRYYYVVYDAVKFKDATGAEVPLSSLPSDSRELDGSSAEITVGIATYF